MDGTIPLLRQIHMMPAERLTSRYRYPLHLAATLTMTIDPKTPFDTYPPMPTKPRQMCHEMRVGEPPIRGKDHRTTERKPLNRAVRLNGHWDRYWQFHRQHHHHRLYG
jgi:hypothetical protein